MRPVRGDSGIAEACTVCRKEQPIELVKQMAYLHREKRGEIEIRSDPTWYREVLQYDKVRVGRKRRRKLKHRRRWP